MIGQVGERNNQFQRLVVWWLHVLKVIRAKQPGETKVFYFPDDLFPPRPGEAFCPSIMMESATMCLNSFLLLPSSY
jgi:hypothetical protein